MSPAAELTDAELAAAMSDTARGAASFDRLYRRHAAPLLAFARARFHHLADDLCQTAWLEAIQHSWKPGDHVRAWLFRVVLNQGVSALRQAGREGGSVPADAAGLADEPIRHLLYAERVARVRHCYDRLRREKPEFEAVVRAFLDGERPEDAARRLDISRANFDQRKKRALDALGRCVESDQGAGER